MENALPLFDEAFDVACSVLFIMLLFSFIYLFIYHLKYTYIYYLYIYFFLCRSFDSKNKFTQADDGPIVNSTVIAFHPDTGKIMHQWGAKT